MTSPTIDCRFCVCRGNVLRLLKGLAPRSYSLLNSFPLQESSKTGNLSCDLLILNFLAEGERLKTATHRKFLFPGYCKPTLKLMSNHSLFLQPAVSTLPPLKPICLSPNPCQCATSLAPLSNRASSSISQYLRDFQGVDPSQRRAKVFMSEVESQDRTTALRRRGRQLQAVGGMSNEAALGRRSDGVIWGEGRGEESGIEEPMPSRGLLQPAEGTRESKAADRFVDPTGDSILAVINRSTKWVVSLAAFCALLLRHDAWMAWCIIGALANSALSKVLKRLLNQQRPKSAEGVKDGPGMPSSHGQSFGYFTVYAGLAVWVAYGPSAPAVAASLAITAAGTFLAWLRVATGLHTSLQVIVGFLVGSLTAIVWQSAWNSWLAAIIEAEVRARRPFPWGNAHLAIFIMWIFVSAIFVNQVVRKWMKKGSV
eukprot:TRINITY_DN29335_c0_g1_i1.p1 TRINITY_DN29335_c0_g1~~TRINITY_DN29335_c0_g1_i1.p1  ORF type:complete len:426 (+),score=28.08 TRINITY_DN29335_c0_g1_i1:813-2090(+)